MGFQTDNQRLLGKVQDLARRMGVDEESALERAVDAAMSLHPARTQVPPEVQAERRAAMQEILARIDALPDRGPSHDPVEWDDLGLPK